MKTINILTTTIKDSFFLGTNKEVTSFEDAQTYGGVTQFGTKLYSNILSDDNSNIIVNDTNTLSIIVLSTINADVVASDFNEYTNYIQSIVESKYRTNANVQYSKGSWYSDDMNKTIIENIAIISITTNDITNDDINFFNNLANEIKLNRSQEAVSIFFNDSLTII